MPHRLDAEQIQTHREQGFLVVDEPLYPAEKFAAFKGALRMAPGAI